MKTRWLSSMVFIFVIFVLGSGLFAAWEDDDDERQFPKNATFTTLITTPRPIEGLTGDNHRNLYTGGSGVPPCPIWQINLNNPALTPVGFVVPATRQLRLLWYRFQRNRRSVRCRRSRGNHLHL